MSRDNAGKNEVASKCIKFYDVMKPSWADLQEFTRFPVTRVEDDFEFNIPAIKRALGGVRNRLRIIWKPDDLAGKQEKTALSLLLMQMTTGKRPAEIATVPFDVKSISLHGSHEGVDEYRFASGTGTKTG